MVACSTVLPDQSRPLVFASVRIAAKRVSTSTCAECPEHCANCTKRNVGAGDANFDTACTRCDPGRFVYLGLCVSSCETGFIVENGECKSATGAAPNVTSCVDGFYLDNGECKGAPGVMTSDDCPD